MDRKITLIAGVSAASVAGTVAHLLAEDYLARGGQPRVIENKGQAMPKGAQLAARGPRAERKARARAAGLELMAASRMTLDVSRLHPRWLRAVVHDMLDAGAQITQTEIEVLRSHGPEGARAVAEAYGGYKS